MFARILEFGTFSGLGMSSRRMIRSWRVQVGRTVKVSKEYFDIWVIQWHRKGPGPQLLRLATRVIARRLLKGTTSL